MPQPSTLGRWYADPQDEEKAQRNFDQATRRMEHRLRHGGGTFCCRLQQMLAKFWQGAEISTDYQVLQGLAARSCHRRALLELVYGQLLLSRQLCGALEHLDKGFNLARNLFTPDDYFTVLNRHRQLRLLPLAKLPSPPTPLKQLLITARVIELLEQPWNKRRRFYFDNHDTYG